MHANHKQAQSVETRYIEFEINVPEGSAGVVELPAYALYNVCESDTGVCRYLRKDFKVVVRIDPEAPKLGR